MRFLAHPIQHDGGMKRHGIVGKSRAAPVPFRNLMQDRKNESVVFRFYGEIASAFFLNDAVKTIINRDHEHLSAAEHVQMNEAVCFGSAFRCLQRIFQKIFGQNGKIGILYGERIRNMNMGGQFYAAFTGKREIMAYQHIDDRIRTEIFDMDTVCFHQIAGKIVPCLFGFPVFPKSLQSEKMMPKIMALPAVIFNNV